MTTRPLETDHTALFTALMTQYEKLKDEQAARIGFRDNMPYVILAAAAGIATLAATVGRAELLLLLPLASVVLGWTRLATDHKISSIRLFIRTQLDPQVAELVGSDGPVFGWEAFHVQDNKRRMRKFLQLVVDLMAYVVPALGTLAVVVALAPRTPLLVAAVTVEFIAVGMLGVQIKMHAALHRPTSRAATRTELTGRAEQ